MELLDILRAAIGASASDIHIVIGQPPMVRHHGQILPLEQFPKITAEGSKALVYSMLYEEQIQRFENDMELDASYEVPGIGRFRINVLLQKNGIEAVLRVISSAIPDPASLKLTEAIVGLTRLPRGLVLVTGPTGSGKTTTLACLIDMINKTRKEHILTIEDPIEFVFQNKGCIVRQRELGTNTRSFKEALKHALRQDPDVILVGEMRDLETISLAVRAAETGHLVFGTLHTQDAPTTVDRMIDVFPTHQQQQIRMQLSSSLKAVVSQLLLPRLDGKGRIAARETMIVTPAISNLIREGKTHMIYSAIETGAKYGMISRDSHLATLVRERQISPEVAISKAQNPEQLRAKVGLGVGPAMQQPPVPPGLRK